MLDVMFDQAIQPILILCASSGLVALQQLKDKVDAVSASLADLIARY